ATPMPSPRFGCRGTIRAGPYQSLARDVENSRLEAAAAAGVSQGMAKLYFYYASMNAGKSTNLLQANFNYGERGMATMLWTAALDTRTEQPIESRIGLGADADRFGPGTNLWDAVTAQQRETPLACVLIDEAQFLT